MEKLSFWLGSAVQGNEREGLRGGDGMWSRSLDLASFLWQSWVIERSKHFTAITAHAVNLQWHDGIVECCVVLHNMIVEDEYTLHYDSSSEEFEFDDWDGGMVRSIDFPISVSTVDDFP